MKFGAFVLVLALGSLAACDSPARHAASPTEPAAASSSAAAAAADRSIEAPRSTASSTTCGAYQERLAVHQATLEHEPGDQAAAEAVVTYTSLIADACN